MREIKFRAWLKDTNEMIEVEDIRLNKPFMINTTSAWRLEDEIILMQYTGLKDKNGKEIYEGDIVTIGIDEIPPFFTKGKVVYSPPAFVLECEDGMERSLELLLDYSSEEVLEVIGNIYENPELLEVNKND